MMRLFVKVTLWYILISLVVFLAGGLVTYQVIKREIDLEQERFLKERLHHILGILEKKQPSKPFEWEKLSVAPLEGDNHKEQMFFSDTLVVHRALETLESHFKLDAIKEVKGRFYKISIYDLIIEESDIVEGVTEALIKLYLILLAVFVLLGIFAYRILLKPFQKTLSLMRAFNIKQDKPLAFPETSTTEFKQLNEIFGKMSSHARKEYQLLKEFTEDFSHEMQTPLSIANGKLEIIMNNPKLSSEQLTYLEQARGNIKKLSRIGESLSLLTKIDNEEFTEIQPIKPGEVLEKLLADFSELIELKAIELDVSLDHETTIEANEFLLDIMLGNLLRNAIYHNRGITKSIAIKHEGENLTISNSGEPLSMPGHEIFERFKRDGNQQKSMGLGLAIVKKVCDVSHFTINHTYEAPIHHFHIKF